MNFTLRKKEVFMSTIWALEFSNFIVWFKTKGQDSTFSHECLHLSMKDKEKIELLSQFETTEATDLIFGNEFSEILFIFLSERKENYDISDCFKHIETIGRVSEYNSLTVFENLQDSEKITKEIEKAKKNIRTILEE